MNALAGFVVAVGAVVGAGSAIGAALDVLLLRRVAVRLEPLGPELDTSPPWMARLRESVMAPRLTRAVDDGLASWLDGAARAARSGAILRHALTDGALALGEQPVARFLDPFVRRLARGEPIDVVLQDLAPDSGPSARRLVRRALSLAATTGGPVAPMLDAVAATLHERMALAREVRALSTQARASAAVMVVAPGLFGALASTLDTRVGAFLGSPGGLACVAIGMALDGFGAWWMARIVRVAS
jgi:Flp pilus assembly protein TadB